MGQAKKQFEQAATGEARPDTPAQKAAKTVDRMKTETIHAQAMTLDHLRRRVDELEQAQKALLEANASLKAKLLAANRTIERIQPSTR